MRPTLSRCRNNLLLFCTTTDYLPAEALKLTQPQPSDGNIPNISLPLSMHFCHTGYKYNNTSDFRISGYFGEKKTLKSPTFTCCHLIIAYTIPVCSGCLERLINQVSANFRKPMFWLQYCWTIFQFIAQHMKMKSLRF